MAAGSVALVSYVPEPLAGFLNGLRQSLTGEECPQTHITVLPPRPLQSAADATSPDIRKLLARFSPFSVELSTLSSFAETNVLYLGISEGSNQLHAIHDALNSGALSHAERFPFHPHVSLSPPADPATLTSWRGRAGAAWDTTDLSRRFLLKELVCLWLPPESNDGAWSGLWSYSLAAQAAPPAAAAAAATAQTY